MGFAGGQPAQLQEVSGTLSALSEDLTADAVAATAQGKAAASHAGDAQVAGLAETALAAIGGAVMATATLVGGLADGATTAADQLVTATGGPR